jgi:integrase
MRVALKHVKTVRRRLASGKTETYHYAWPGGPRLRGAPGSPEFIQSYNEAWQQTNTAPDGSLAALTTRYRMSPAFTNLADSTRREWGRWLDRIQDRDDGLGWLTMKALEDRRVRADLIDWRDKYAAHPRTADMALQVLSRVLAYGLDRGMLAINPASGISKLWRGDRSDVIWTPEEIALYRERAPTPEAGFILPLACYTGLRREDLARLRREHVNDIVISKPTGKSGGKRIASVPILPETRELLAEIEAQRATRGHASPYVLTNSRGAPWTPSGLSHAIAGFVPGKRLHDARGTFVTRLRLAGTNASKVADIVGWSEDRVERLLSIYVDREAIVLDVARTLSGKRLENAREA